MRWRHKKTGGTYREIGRGRMQTSGWLTADPRSDYAYPVDMHDVVVYQSEKDGSLWVRPVEEFEDGRFERIEE